MARVVWDQTGEKLYETGVRNGVLYPMASNGTYPTGVAWNGLTAVTESPTGAEANPLYADDQKYLNLISAEEFEATVEAYMYPLEFGECDGSASVATGVYIGQQPRKTFGLSYRTILGNDVAGESYGYKLHIIWGAIAAPSEKAYETVNDSPDAITFSWELSTTPIPVTGFKPTASMTIDSTVVNDEAKMKALEAVLYGVDADEFDASKTYAVGDYCTHDETVGTETVTKTYVCKTAITTPAAWDATNWTVIANPGPHLPTPAEIITLMS